MELRESLTQAIADIYRKMYESRDPYILKGTPKADREKRPVELGKFDSESQARSAMNRYKSTHTDLNVIQQIDDDLNEGGTGSEITPESVRDKSIAAVANILKEKGISPRITDEAVSGFTKKPINFEGEVATALSKVLGFSVENLRMDSPGYLINDEIYAKFRVNSDRLSGGKRVSLRFHVISWPKDDAADFAVSKARRVNLGSLDEGDDPCWKGYKQRGMKDKGGKKVPNCIPESKKLTDLKAGETYTGRVKFINRKKGYGGVTPDSTGVNDSEGVRHDFETCLFSLKNKDLNEGDKVNFTVDPSKARESGRYKHILVPIVTISKADSVNEETNLSGKSLVNSLTSTCLSSWYDLTKKFTARPDVFDVHDETPNGSYNVFKMTPGNDVRDQAYEAAVSTTTKLAQNLNKQFGKEVFEPRISRTNGSLETLVAFKTGKGGVFQVKAKDNGGDSTIYLTMPKQEELTRAFSAMADVPTPEDDPDNGIDPSIGDEPDAVAGDPIPDYDPDSNYESEPEDDFDDPTKVGLEDEEDDFEEDVSVGGSISAGDATANPAQTADAGGPGNMYRRKKGFTGGPFGR